MDLSRIHQTALDSMREVVYIRDLDMNILYMNPASVELTGWSLEEAKSTKCYELFGGEHARCKELCL
ncbi:MAG: PAS domain-containing protein, partial [Deltaproteobacteria bacterium]